MRKIVKTYKIFESESGQYFRIQHRGWMIGDILHINNRLYDILYNTILQNRNGEYSDITNTNIEIDRDKYCIILSIDETEEVHIREKADEWFYVGIYQSDEGADLDDDWARVWYFKCDQIEGVLRLLKDRGIL